MVDGYVPDHPEPEESQKIKDFEEDDHSVLSLELGCAQISVMGQEASLNHPPSTILLNRQPNRDACALADFALEVDGPFMQFHKFL